MSTIVWTTLITAVATVTGSLGAVWIKGLIDDRAQARQAEEARRQAEQASAAAASDRQRDAYAVLLGTARYWLSAAEEIRQEFKGLPADRAIDRSPILVQDLTQAVARVELVGTDISRSGAEAIYDKSMAVGHVFALHLRQLTAAHDDAAHPSPSFAATPRRRQSGISRRRSTHSSNAPAANRETNRPVCERAPAHASHTMPSHSY